MRFLSKPNETGRTDMVQTALHEAARYEAETAAPEDLVVRALARHGRSGNRCDVSRLAPALLASACGMVILIGCGFWLHRSQPLVTGHSLPGRTTAVRTKPNTVAPVSIEATYVDIGPALLPPIGTAEFLISAGPLRHRHRRTHQVSLPHPHPSLVQNSPLPPTTNRSASVWTTETVEREVVTQTLTPVWVAHTDPETATITMTPALFQLALQPNDDADPAAAEVRAALILVQFEQEKTHP